jgi:hypothetical protein
MAKNRQTRDPKITPKVRKDLPVIEIERGDGDARPEEAEGGQDVAARNNGKQTATPEWGGLPVKEVTIAEVDIPDSEAEQKAVADPDGQRPAQGAKKEKSTRKAKAKRAGDTGADRADTGPKARSVKGKAAPKPDRSITVGELSESFLRHLELIGKSRGTVFSYGIELKAATKYFGEDTKVSTLTTRKVADYFDSDAVTNNRKGKPKSQLTIDKTRRVFRFALEWLAEVGVLETAPLPETKKRDKSRN